MAYYRDPERKLFKEDNRLILIASWAWMATLQLARMTRQDYKRLLVDDRLNSFMTGASMLFLVSQMRGALYSLVLVLLSFILPAFIMKLRVFGEGDAHALSWLFIGWGAISPIDAFFYFCFLLGGAILHYASQRWILRDSRKHPFFLVFLASFIGYALLRGIYRLR